MFPRRTIIPGAFVIAAALCLSGCAAVKTTGKVVATREERSDAAGILGHLA